ncbi:hypothetical protein O181_005213 [Austropuccinia psidii MF-1]|uniref:Uncharacterized protein n=1 Tax=Austropuccinia psidii MF-1 TaxID=1389203 RepID=A0A9Q3BHU7_9BASI|nr:hypothetical protein [Austropuccinia psidii MF-1]
MVHGGYWSPPGPKYAGASGGPWDQTSPIWPGPIKSVQDHQELDLPKVEGEVLGVMSSKLTELTESSPSAPPPSVLCGSGILIQLASPWSMASSSHFDPAQTYDSYKAVEVLDPACTKCLAKGRDCFQH